MRPLRSHSLCPHGEGPASGGTRAQHGPQGHGLKVRHRSLLKLTTMSPYPQRGVRGEPAFHHVPSEGSTPAGPWSPIPEELVFRSVSTAARLVPGPVGSLPHTNGGGWHLGKLFHQPGKPAKAGALTGGRRPGGAAICTVTEETLPKVPTDRSIYIFIFIHIILN